MLSTIFKTIVNNYGRNYSFYTPEFDSFQSFFEQTLDKPSGFSQEICRVLSECNSGTSPFISQEAITRPSAIQAASFSSILSGHHTAIGAETGSGKSLAYILPLLFRLQPLITRRFVGGKKFSRYPFAIVLSANRELAQQTYRYFELFECSMRASNIFAASTLSDSNQSRALFHSKFLPSTEQLAMHFPVHSQIGSPSATDILVTTPSSFRNLLNYQHMKQLKTRQHRSRAFKRLPIIGAEQDNGKVNVHPLLKHSRMLVFDEADMILSGSFEDSIGRDLLSALRKLNKLGGKDKEKDHHQVVFGGATWPDQSHKSVKSKLSRFFPTMQWITTKHLHASPSSEAQKKETFFFCQNETEKRDKLYTLLKEKTEFCVVFTNTVESAVEVASMLKDWQVPYVEFHKLISHQQRQQALDSFQSRQLAQEKGDEKNSQQLVFVCTNLAARGIDFVKKDLHVIQYDFATSAVDYLHRIGRTGRADSACGEITNLYTPKDQDLVREIQQHQAEKSVDGLFSRSRSFRRRMKRRSQRKLDNKVMN